MSIKKSVDELVTRPMDRREFLANTGAAVLTIVGIPAVLKAFGMKNDLPKQSSGYGASPYGGGKEQ